MPPPKKPATPDTLDDAMLRRVAARGSVRSFPAHAVLVTEDDRSDALFIILGGRVKAYGATADGREIIYSTQGPGEYFGEMTLDGGARSASVMTLEATTCAVVSAAELRAFMAEEPEFAMHVLRKLIRLLRASTEQVKSLALDDVYSRITRLLRRMGQPVPGEDGVLLVPDKMTQQDIAERIGSSREMVSRVFKPLQAGGYVEMRGGRIAVLKKLPARW